MAWATWVFGFVPFVLAGALPHVDMAANHPFVIFVLAAVIGVLLPACTATPAHGALAGSPGWMAPGTDRPVIGVLCQEQSPLITKHCGHHDCYIAASYVKFIEGAGGQVAPVLIGQTPEYYRKLVRSVNGLLFPGGATYFDGTVDGYGATGKRLYELALEINDAGVHFPVFGICLGMELLAVAAVGEDFRQKCNSEKPLALNFLPGSDRNSRLFARAPSSVLRTLQTASVTVNHHKLCVTPKDMERQGLRNWRMLTVNKDANDVEFVSVFEHRFMPLYGVMFHPEKNIYEWKRSKNYPHSEVATAASRYFADFLVSEARLNAHSFPEAEERDHLIYKHQPVDTKGKLMWEQLYVFDFRASPSPQGAESTGTGEDAHANSTRDQ